MEQSGIFYIPCYALLINIMERLTDKEKEYLKGYAEALQGMMYKITGENTCAKSYDPIDFSDGVIHSYAFDMKDGGRHHPLKDYKNVDDICKCMLNEAVKWCEE